MEKRTRSDGKTNNPALHERKMYGEEEFLRQRSERGKMGDKTNLPQRFKKGDERTRELARRAGKRSAEVRKAKARRLKQLQDVSPEA